MKIKHWQEMSEAELSLESIQKLFVPSQDFRISKSEYLPGTKFPGSTRAGTFFVISGNCCCCFENEEVTLSAGDVIDLPSGSYDLSVLGNDNLVIVRVWNLADVIREIKVNETVPGPNGTLGSRNGDGASC